MAKAERAPKGAKAAPAKAEPAAKKSQPTPVSRLQVKYKQDVAPGLIKEFKYKSPMQVPGLVKITVNMGVGESTTNSKAIDSAVEAVADP